MRILTKSVTVFLALFAFASVATGPAQAQSGGGNLGSLQRVLPATGQEDAWRFSNAGSGFEIENIGDPQAIKYFFANIAPGSEGSRQIETALSIHPDSTGAAGLLYGLNGNRDVYHLLTLGADGTVTLFRRDPSGFRPMLETSSSAFLPGQVNRLRIVETGDEIAYYLNDTSLGGLGGDLFGSGAVGIAALGDVRALFTAFSDGTTQQGANTGAGQPPPVPGQQPPAIPGQQPPAIPAGQQQPPAIPGQQQPPRIPGAQQTNAPSQDLRLRRVQIFDERGPAGRVLAYETLVPEGWDVNGGVMWNTGDKHNASGCFTGAKLIWGAGTPDERYGVAFLSPISWGVSNVGPVNYLCMQQDFTDAEAAMRAYFQNVSQILDVSMIEVLRPPEIQPLVAMFAQQAQSNIPGTRAWADGVVVKARIKSQTSENDTYVLGITTHMELQFDGMMTRRGDTKLIFAVSTPVGALDQGHPGFGAILNNLRVNPQWKQLEQQWWSAKLRQPRPRAGGTVAGSSSSVGDMMFDSWKRRQDMQDAGHASSTNSVWEVQPWESSSGSTILLDQDYDHAWELDNGTIILTNDANYNPMQDAGETGQEMQPRF